MGRASAPPAASGERGVAGNSTAESLRRGRRRRGTGVERGRIRLVKEGKHELFRLWEFSGGGGFKLRRRSLQGALGGKTTASGGKNDFRVSAHGPLSSY